MRILHTSIAKQEPASSVDREQIESLENMGKALLKRLESIQDRLDVLEEAQKSAAAPVAFPVISVPEPTAPEPVLAQPVIPAPVVEAAPAPVQEAPSPLAPVSADFDAVKKNLLNKMWKYMNDESSKAV